jgi:hypothetical protein
VHIVHAPKLTSMRGVSLASTPSSPSFGLVQVRESNPRHTVYQTVALPI